MSDSPCITSLIRKWQDGDTEAFERLSKEIMTEMRKIAYQRLKDERKNHTLQITALVNETYVRIMGSTPETVNDTDHLRALIGTCMRHILQDYGRRRQALKRGSGQSCITLIDAMDEDKKGNELDAFNLERALQKYEKREPRGARVFVCRYFGGLTVPATATVLKVSESTVIDDWRKARGFLARELFGRTL